LHFRRQIRHLRWRLQRGIKRHQAGAKMRQAEDVTFGGSGLDRAAALRSDAAGIAALLAAGDVVPLWRGKPLIAGDALAWVGADHPVLAAGKPALFLGLDEGRARFAVDISHWQPDQVIEAGFLDQSLQTHPALPESHAFQDLRAVMAALSPRDAELAATAKALLQWHSTHGFCASCGAASGVVNAGWQRSCPACNAQHFPRTDPVVIMLVVRGNRLLLGRSAPWPAGMYSLLAGFVEPGEPLEAAVRREVFEETGVTVGTVRYLASQPWPFPASLMFGCICEATSDQITVDPVELEDARWVTREELVQVLAGEHPVIKPGRKGAIAHFLMTNWLADRLE
jgi:NAD+ diphosphatase